MVSHLPCLYPVYCNHNFRLEPVEWFLHQQGLSILFLVITFHFLVTLNKRENKGMGSCLSKLNDKSFTIHTPPVTSGHLKKVASDIGKNPV